MTYADTYVIRSSSVNANAIALGLDGLVSDLQTSISTATINTTSTTSVDYTGVSITVTTNTNEKVLILAHINCSANAATTSVVMDVTQDGSIITTAVGGFYLTSRNNTGGADGTISISAYSAPTAGSHTYKIQWKVSGNTGYSTGARLTVLVVQAG